MSFKNDAQPCQWSGKSKSTTRCCFFSSLFGKHEKLYILLEGQRQTLKW